MIQLRDYSQEADYPVLSLWWAAHGWSPPHPSVLPKLAVIAQDGDLRVGGAFLYMDNSVGVSMMEWLVTNPDSTGRQSLEAIKHLCDFLAQRAKELGYGVMLTSCKQPGLARIYERNGFTRTDEAMIHLARNLT